MYLSIEYVQYTYALYDVYDVYTLHVHGVVADGADTPPLDADGFVLVAIPI